MSKEICVDLLMMEMRMEKKKKLKGAEVEGAVTQKRKLGIDVKNAVSSSNVSKELQQSCSVLLPVLSCQK